MDGPSSGDDDGPTGLRTYPTGEAAGERCGPAADTDLSGGGARRALAAAAAAAAALAIPADGEPCRGLGDDSLGVDSLDGAGGVPS